MRRPHGRSLRSTLTAAAKRPTVGTRRFGYVIAALVNAALLYAANGWPGWAAVPFRTAETAILIGLVNESITVSLGANLMDLVRDPRWLKAVGDMLTAAVGLVACIRIGADPGALVGPELRRPVTMLVKPVVFARLDDAIKRS